MLDYRDISTDLALAELVWTAEQKLPAWFREASETWTPDLPGFQEFWTKVCDEVQGLFDSDWLLACVYLETIAPNHINIHISVIEKWPTRERDLLRFFQHLRNQKAAEGYTIQTGWLLERNRPMLKLAEKAGYIPTGLRMMYRSLKWIQVRGS